MDLEQMVEKFKDLREALLSFPATEKTQKDYLHSLIQREYEFDLKKASNIFKLQKEIRISKNERNENALEYREICKLLMDFIITIEGKPLLIPVYFPDVHGAHQVLRVMGSRLILDDSLVYDTENKKEDNFWSSPTFMGESTQE